MKGVALGWPGRKLCPKKRRLFLSRRQCVADDGKLTVTANRVGHVLCALLAALLGKAI
jgi:hypothetical protein